jgi:malate dehydrogenase
MRALTKLDGDHERRGEKHRPAQRVAELGAALGIGRDAARIVVGGAMARNKIALIGAGQIGGTLAHLIGLKELGDVVLFDIAEGIPQGKALDLVQSSPVDGFDARFTGTNSYEAIEGAAVCIVTAGVPRKPGMSRDDLLGINLKVMEQVGAGHQEIRAERLRHLHHQSARRHGLGAAEVLRPAEEHGRRHGRRARLGALPLFPGRRVQRLGRGRHRLRARRPRRHMVPLVRYSTVAGIPLPDLVKMGWTTQDGSTRSSIAPATAAARSSPAQDRLGLLRAGGVGDRHGGELSARQEAGAAGAAWLNGEYGVKDLYVGVPVVIGAKGVERSSRSSSTAPNADVREIGASVEGLVEACKKIAIRTSGK